MTTAALSAGADGLKFFPAEATSLRDLKALRAVLPREALIFSVGGITPYMMENYWRAGASGFGLGSSLYKTGKRIGKIKSDVEAFIQEITSLNRNLAEGPPQ